MTYWTVDKRHYKQEADYLGKAIIVGLILLGLLIGASVGLYVAAKTLPLPNVTTNIVTPGMP